MRNIRKFETFEDYLASQESVSGSGKYVEDIRPGFVYVKERYEDGTYSFYNGEDIGQEEEYEFGDVVYYVEGQPKLKKVYYSAFTPDMGEKVGLVVVPTALSPDGNARIMAFGSITTDAPAPAPAPTSLSVSKPEAKDTLLGASTTYTKAYPMWTDRLADENQTVYTCVPAFNLGGGSAPQASAPGSEGRPSYYEYPLYLGFSTSSSTFSSDANYAYPNPHTNNEYYNATDTLVAISPFLGDSLKEQDSKYLQEEFTEGTYPAYNAFSDFSGYTWTYGCPPEYMTPGAPALKSSKPVSGTSNPYFPHDHVRHFYTDGTAEGDWYLPSMGEMGFVAARYKKIMEIFEYLKSVGAYVEDGTDNMPGLGRNGLYPIWTSTVGAGVRPNIAASEPTMSASIPGNSTSPYVYPIALRVEATNSNSNLVFDLQFAFYYEDERNEVLPFAMIKKGEIQKTMGDYTVVNRHQMKDYQGSPDV